MSYSSKPDFNDSEDLNQFHNQCLDQMVEDMGECFTLRVRNQESIPTSSQAIDKLDLMRLDMLATLKCLLAFPGLSNDHKATPLVESSPEKMAVEKRQTLVQEV